MTSVLERCLSKDKLDPVDRQGESFSIEVHFRKIHGGASTPSRYSRMLRGMGYNAYVTETFDSPDGTIKSGFLLVAKSLPERVALELHNCLKSPDSPDLDARRLNPDFKIVSPACPLSFNFD